MTQSGSNLLDTARSLLVKSLPGYKQRVHEELIDSLMTEFKRNIRRLGINKDLNDQMIVARGLADSIRTVMRNEYDRIQSIRLRLVRFITHYNRGVSISERRLTVLDFAQALGATKQGLRKDKEAFSRWFGFDAVKERAAKRIGESEHRLVFLMERFGYLVHFYLKRLKDVKEEALFWQEMNCEEEVWRYVIYEGDDRVQISAFICLSVMIDALSEQNRDKVVSARSLAYIFRSALDRNVNIWIQTEALALLDRIGSRHFQTVLIDRLAMPGKGDDLFLRRRACFMACKRLKGNEELAEVVRKVLKDPSPYVRQGLSEALLLSPLEFRLELLKKLALNDESFKVRAYAVQTVAGLIFMDDMKSGCISIICEFFEKEQDGFALRVCLESVSDSCIALSRMREYAKAREIYEAIKPGIELLAVDFESYYVRRWAAACRERLRVYSDESAHALLLDLEARIEKVRPGKSCALPGALVKEHGLQAIGRILSVLSQKDYSLAVGRSWRGYRIYRGDVFGFQLWRFFHEFFHPSPDKRQAYTHLTGRIAKGVIRAPSGIMAEMTQTKVPGEPLKFSEEDGWRPYLPLPNEALELLSNRFPREVLIFTPEGVTRMRRKWFLGGLWSSFKMTVFFNRYAKLRNWKKGSNLPADTYGKTMGKMGLDLDFTFHGQEQQKNYSDTSITRFFPAIFAYESMWSDFKGYFFSVYGNSIYELGLFSGAMLTAFLGSRIWQGFKIKKARKKIPFCLGGWGTRGKSGVERLKAAFFEAVGVSSICKTTGCEAMFLYSYPFGKTREMFLFRPYDKATIWEHANVIFMGRDMHASVFLWECMALNPQFVKILQRKWSRDDYSTITNTYPDHEDIQGPSGLDIPRVMINFIPENGRLITSEEEMTPILRDGAKELGTTMSTVSSIQAGLITEDILERFPYAEHPMNIALVTSLAKELGVSEDFVLKEMADRVVPDIGVLKSFPKAEVLGRKLEFVNGMSANERFATLANWRRMNFDSTPPEDNPDVFISTLVNNRADRLSRSRMFADIVAGDLPADCHVLIGTNLTGLKGYLKTAWDNRLEGLSLFDGNGEENLTSLYEIAGAVRLLTSRKSIQARLMIMLQCIGGSKEMVGRGADLWDDPDNLAGYFESEGLSEYQQDYKAYHVRILQEYEDYSGLIKDVREGGSNQRAIDSTFRQKAEKWFWDRVVVISDQHATGDEVVSRIAKATPPGLLNRIMGLQNIKGTGLDFVYRWQAWEKCHELVTKVRSNEILQVHDGLQGLSFFNDFGVLSENSVRSVLEEAKNSDKTRTEQMQASLSIIETNLESKMKEVRQAADAGVSTGLLSHIFGVLESLLDAGDAISRRKKSELIYKDLVGERISIEQAALELQKLNKRQKGGWLARQLGNFTQRLKSDS
jgi:poly-gamma-glutamate synthase PgsB/CapB